MQQQNFPIASIKIISPAEVPRDPSSPRKKAMLFIGFLLGGLLGSVAGATRELVPKPARTVSELRQQVGISCAGLLPDAASLGKTGAEQAKARTLERLAQACEANAAHKAGLLIGIAPLTPGLKRVYDLPLQLANRLSRDGSRKVLVVFAQSPTEALPAEALTNIEIVNLQAALDDVQVAEEGEITQSALARDVRGHFDFALLVMDPLSLSEQSDPQSWAYDMTLLRIPWGQVLPRFISDALLDHPRFSEALTTTVLEDADLSKARRYISPGSYEELKINA